MLASPSAYASCDQALLTVTCSGTTTNYAPGNLTNTTINVLAGAIVQGTNGTDAINVNLATAVTLNNFGTIDGRVVFTGTADFTNYGILRMTDPTTVGTGLSHSIPGTFEQTASGSLFSRVDAAAFYDGLFASDVKLNGKSVAVIQPGIYSTPVTYTAVNYSGTRTGQFASVLASSPFFTMTADYGTAGQVDITLTSIAFNAVSGLTPNQKVVATALQNAYAAGTPTGNAATLFSNLFAATSVNVFDQLSGEGVSAAQGASFMAGSFFSSSMMQQGLLWLNGTPGGGNSVTFGGPSQYAADARVTNKPGYEAFASVRPQASPEPGRWRAWAAGFGATRSVNGEASTGSSDQSQRTAGGAVGVDHQIGANLLLGFSVGGSESTFSVSNLATSGRIDGGHIGVYAIKTLGAAYLAATLNYARFDNKTDRTITGIGPTETASGRFNSDQLSGRLELGWKRGFDGFSITPFVAIEPAVLWQHQYSETSTTAGGGAGVLGLNYQSHTASSLPTFLGAQVDARYALANGLTLSPFARTSWVHEFEPDRQIQASFISVPSAAFIVDGARAARDALRVDTGATLALNRGTSLFASINGEYSDRSRTYAAIGGAKMTW